MEWIALSSGVFGAICGGLITGIFSLKATDKAFSYQRIQRDEHEKKVIDSLLQAIHDERETLWDRYQETMRSKIESLNDGEPLNIYYPLVSDFFTVYNGNSFLIGNIQDNDLRKQIIKTYTLLKGLVDSFRMNNDLVNKFEHAFNIYKETQNEIHKEQAEAHYRSMTEYTKTLKQTHQIVKQEASTLLRLLRKHGVLSEKR